MAQLGEILICLAALFSAAGAVVAFRRGADPAGLKSAANLFNAAAASGFLSIVILAYLMITHDYRVTYVHEYADRTMSTGFLLTAIWGGQHGSLLLWAVLQTVFTAAAANWCVRSETGLARIALPALGGYQIYFLMMVLFLSNPFGMPTGAETPTDGIGLNPLLRNYYMVLHPPTLFLGFVGFSVPMAFAFAALVVGKFDDAWLSRQRPWILFAWIFLTIGNLLGMIWAYEELGWGGYWGWDPVENASLMPWFTSTALLHSAIAQDRRNILPRWNFLLIILTFALILFGTFLTRSGVIQSVHAFSGAKTGPYLLALIAITAGPALALLLIRSRRIASDKTIEVWSRDWMFSVNNWLFIAATLFVGLATLWPLITALISSQQATVPPEFYNKWMVPVGLSVLGLLALGILTPWRQSKEHSNRKGVYLALGVGIAAGTISALAGAHRPSLGGPMAFAPAIAIGIIAATAVALLRRLRRTLITAQDTERNRRRIGAMLAHAGTILMFIGFTGNGFIEEAQGSLGPGQSLHVNDYQIRFLGLRTRADAEKESAFADLQVVRGNEDLGVLSPSRNFYHSHPNQPTSEVVIRGELGEDLFIALGDMDFERGRAVIRAIVNPLVFWIWAGGFLLIIATIVALARPGSMTAWLRMDAPLRARLARPAIFIGLASLLMVIGGAVSGLPTAIAALGALTIIMIAVYIAGAVNALTGTPNR